MDSLLAATAFSPLIAQRDWISVMETFGLAGIILGFVGVCIWRGAGWTAAKVVSPVVDRYIALIDALIISVTKQGDAMVRMVEIMSHLADKIQPPHGE